MEWIKTSEALPELCNEFAEHIAGNYKMPRSKTSKKCLVVIDGNVTDSSLLWREDKPNESHWMMLSGKNVTHWMYYPEPPKE